ncbi:zeta toxin family protein [Marinobacter sp. X15-166B]|uniref:zeta toxin family protein n=1 Tax=Marinobacter sp. X15-166B TaxID=1897620 RepID=UPI00085C8708|nr:AAA family ATPase [Marinobacter sp. X15-166B]OEY67536.1 hypothetical protein BG841_14565 [Marinobacter sp. X15-166B]
MTAMTPPDLWLLAGGNGSGKSTFYERFLHAKQIPFVNADLFARTLWPAEPEKHSYEAALIAEKERIRLLEERHSFCFETVFSHPSKIDFVATAKAAGYRVRVFYFHLQTPDLNAARVHSRVAAGGHRVPEDKIRARIPRTLYNVRQLVGLVDELFLIDNSSLDTPYVRIASWQQSDWVTHRLPLPDWAKEIMA